MAGEEQYRKEEGGNNGKEVEENGKKGGRLSLTALLSTLTGRQWLTFGLLYLANLCSAMTFSCIVPFFPTEARMRGLSISEVGLIIGAFQITMFCASPLLGKFITKIGPNRMFTGGLLLTAAGTMLYGLLPFFPSTMPFFIAAMAFRCASALGNSGFRTSSLTLIAQQFPRHIASVVGLSQTSMSIGYTVGPTIGSGLYEFGGFSLPFLALGSLILLSAMASILLFVFANGEKAVVDGKMPVVGGSGEGSKQVSLWRILCIPEMALTMLSLFSVELALFFYDASLTEHLMPLAAHPSLLAGLLLSLTSLVCMLSSPIWGILIDRRGCFQPLMIFGTTMCLLFPLLLGPTPLLPIQLSIPSLCLSFAIQGLAITTLHTPSFKFCIEGAKKQGFAEGDTGTTGCISGLINGAVALGAFIGVTGGGFCVQWIGFEQASTLAAFIQIIPLVAHVWHYARTKLNRRQP